MRFTVTLLGHKLTLEAKLWNLCFKTHGFQVSVYKATISDQGWCTWWPQRSQYYRRGFVFRFLWLGFILRQGAVKVKKFKTPLWWGGDAEEVF